MTYNEALKLLNDSLSNVKSDVYLFIAPPKSEMDIYEFRITKSVEENKSLLEKYGFIDSNKLDVFATYIENDKIYYPNLAYYLLAVNNTQKK